MPSAPWFSRVPRFFLLGRALASPALFLGLFFPLLAAAQTLTITEGIQIYDTLTNITATLTGRSELRVTSSATPLSGCVINLNSADAWLLFTNVRPAVVASTYLGQIRVNGAAAVSGTNVRIVQYALGTVVIPHTPAFQPFQAFTGPAFTGTSQLFSQYTYYNTAASLGVLNRAISSFKLKRGYMATVSTQTNGSGPSKVYIAQDGDLEVGLLPAELDNAIQFVRVFPWRWVSKKGSCDVSPVTLDAAWFYNWNNDQSSTLNYEYVPIRQQRYWPGLPTNKPDSVHLLGFNEPNNPVEDAYETLGEGSIDTAIAVWPELLATGLRVGSPAVTDGGESWLYEFMDKADAADLRVDFVAIHFYRCGYTATQLYNWLYNIHVRTGRPLWVTEFNNGANWTTCTDPTLAQNATAIAEFTEMMDNAPFIERYAVYSAVEDVRRMVDTSGNLTAAGTLYKANASPNAYTQRIPATGGRGLAQLPFDGSALDTSGFGNHGLAAVTPVYTAGQRGQAVQLDGANNYIQLPADTAKGAAFSFAGWVYWNGGSNWQRIFDFGSDTTHYMFLTPGSAAGTLRFVIRNGGSEQIVEAAGLATGQWQHIAVTLASGTVRLYRNGVQVATGAVSITPAQVPADLNYLGKSQFPADPLFAGRLDDVRIADYAFSATQVAALMTDTPPQFTNSTLSGGNATQGQAYSGTVAGTATDPDAGDTLAYSKASGPAWLVVAADGTLSGTPTYTDEGAQAFTLAATDSAGATAYAVLTITLPSVLGNGTWTADASGTWSDTARWTSGFPANGAGYTADFSTLNITADRTVTLDGSRSLGTLRFGDTSGAQNWTLASSAGGTITLDTGTATSPSLAVSQNTATLSAPLAGSNGFTKSGAGTLVLAGANSLSGTVNIDTASNAAAEGTVRLAHPGALAGASSIQIRTNNAGSSTLALDGSLGSVSASAPLSLSGRAGTVPALRNLSGDNTLSGTLTVNTGGSNYYLQSDAGTLTLGGATATATGARTLTFLGAGNVTVSGVVANGSATLAVVKEGAGRLSFTGSSTFTGGVTVNGGTLALLGSGALYASGWNNTASLTVNSGAVLELDRWGYGPTGAYRTQSLGGLDYNPARLVLNGGTLRYTGGAAGAPLNPSESPYGPGFTIGAAGATLDAAKANDTWTVKNDSRGTGPVANAAGGTLVLTGVGHGIFDKVLPGTGGLTKSGTGTWTLPLANTYTGATTVGAGTLRVNGSTATGPVTVANGATLGGTGTVGGAVTVQSGATLAPGAGGIGRLTVASSVSLLAGSAASLEINKAAGTRDTLAVSGTLTLGGTLVVTNLGGTLAAGDSFTLFEAGSFGGSFSAYTLPTLAAGLEWDTTALATGGVLAIRLAPSVYAGWSAGYAFASGQDGPTFDPDNDGMPNALEWLFGADPLAADSTLQPQTQVRTLSTAEFPEAESGKHYLTLTGRIRKTYSGMTLVPQANSSLETLDTPASSEFISSFLVNDLDDFEERTWIYTQPVEDSAGGRAFMRLKLTQP